MQHVIRRIVTAGAGAAAGSAVAGSSHPTETESLHHSSSSAVSLSTADLQPTNRYVFEPEVDSSDVVCINKEDINASGNSRSAATTATTAVHRQGQSGDASTVRRYASLELIQTMKKVSPTSLEVDAAIKSISDHPDVLNHCLPNFSSLDEPFRNSIMGAVKGILTPNLIKSTQENIRRAEEEENCTSDDFNCKNNSCGDAGAIFYDPDSDRSDGSRSSSSLSYGLGPYTAEVSDSFLFEDTSCGSAGTTAAAAVSEQFCTRHQQHQQQQRDPLLQWELLKDKYPCAICQDLLAAPSILNCSHSFCGSCLNDMVDSCVLAGSRTATTTATATTAADEDDELDTLHTSCEIAYRCPQCKEEITSTIFERLLDSDIQRLVDAVPECEAKKHWKQRRSDFLKSQLSKRAHQKSSSRNSSRRSSSRAQQQRRGRTVSEVDDDEFWETVKEYAIPLLSFAVLALICVCRMK